MKEEISFKELYSMLKKKWMLIVNLTLVGLLGLGFYTFFIATPEYSSTTQLLVNRTQQADAIQRSDIDTNVQLINTYKDIVKGPVILDEVREELNLDMSHNALSEQITISNEANSQVFSIRVTDTNPYNAANISNTTAVVFQENLDALMNVDNVSIISQAEPNLTPISPNHIFNLAVGVALGGMIGIGIAFLIEYLDNTVNDEKYIVEEMGWTSLGRISEMNAEELKSDARQATPEHTRESRAVRSRV